MYHMLPTSRKEADKEMATLAIISFDIPGDAKFPLNAMYGKPQSSSEAGEDIIEITKDSLIKHLLFWMTRKGIITTYIWIVMKFVSFHYLF